MNASTRYARRYYWLGSLVKDFVDEPHSAICCYRRDVALNLAAQESHNARTTIAQVGGAGAPGQVGEGPEPAEDADPSPQAPGTDGGHPPNNISRTLVRTYERKTADSEGLLALHGVGLKTVRALSLVAELTYDAPSSIRDPALYSFAHGGKDGYLHPVDRMIYDETSEYLYQAVWRAKMGDHDWVEGLRRLERFWRDAEISTTSNLYATTLR